MKMINWSLAAMKRRWSELWGRLYPKDKQNIFFCFRYMSINAHQAKTQGRRDDLESLSYMLLYFFTGHLPWIGFVGSTNKEKYRKIKNSKGMFKSDFKKYVFLFPLFFVFAPLHCQTFYRRLKPSRSWNIRQIFCARLVNGNKGGGWYAYDLWPPRIFLTAKLKDAFFYFLECTCSVSRITQIF